MKELIHDGLVTGMIAFTAALTVIGLIFALMGNPGAWNMVLGCSIPCAIIIGAWYGPQIFKEDNHA